MVMTFKDILRAKSKGSGKKTIAPKKQLVGTKRAETQNEFKGILKASAKEKELNAVKPKMLGRVTKWSFSGLKNFERCPMSVKLDKIDRLPQKQGDAAARGSMIHDMCEKFVRGDIETLTPDSKTNFDPFALRFTELRLLYARNDKSENGIIAIEEEWGVRIDWSGCSWQDKELWGRAKLDVFVREDKTSCRIIDYKTGRKFGNEMKHADQGLSYAVNAYHRFGKEIEHFTVEFWYLDQGETTIRRYSARQLEILQPRLHKRALAMTTEVQFRPKSNADTCRFCAYGANRSKKGVMYGTGKCRSDFYAKMDEGSTDPSDEEGDQNL